MTADTTTSRLKFLLQGTGNNNNAWGQNLNDQVIQFADDAIAGASVITSTGGSYTLTDAEARSALLLLGNTLTSNLTIVAPDNGNIYRVVNFNALNAFFTLFKCSTNATTVNVPNQKTTQIIVGISGIPVRADKSEIGRYVYDALTVNGDALECDGALYKRATFPDLFGKIGTTFGTSDSTDFAVPDAKTNGRFLRSRTASVAAGTSQANQNKSHTHTGSGTTSGQSATHTHTGSGTTATQSADHTHTGSGTTSGISADHTHTGSGTTATQSADHTHTGTTGGQSASHTHTGSGTTDAMSANAAHTHALGAAQSAFIVSVNNGNLTSQGNLVCTNATISAGLTTSSTNTDHTHTYSFTTSTGSADHTHNITTGTQSASHTHTYSFTTSGVSADHTHTYSFTTSGVSASHTHTYSFTTAVGSVDHTHTYSFTTSTGSADGTEARPESLVAILCIRY